MEWVLFAICVLFYVSAIWRFYDFRVPHPIREKHRRAYNTAYEEMRQDLIARTREKELEELSSWLPEHIIELMDQINQEYETSRPDYSPPPTIIESAFAELIPVVHRYDIPTPKPPTKKKKKTKAKSLEISEYGAYYKSTKGEVKFIEGMTSNWYIETDGSVWVRQENPLEKGNATD